MLGRGALGCTRVAQESAEELGLAAGTREEVGAGVRWHQEAREGRREWCWTLALTWTMLSLGSRLQSAKVS